MVEWGTPVNPNVSVKMVVYALLHFCVSRRRRKMYCGHARLCVSVSVCLSVCLSACQSVDACLHYYTDPNLTWGSGRGCPLVCIIGRICNQCLVCVAMATLEMRGRAQL